LILKHLDQDEPEQYYKKVVALIFSTGKVICTGGRKKEDVERAYTNLLGELTEHGFL